MTENEKKPTIAIIGGGRNAGRTIQAQMELLVRIDELEQYRAIGTVEGYKRAIDVSLENYNLYKQYKEKVQAFEAIGTIEECRTAVERMKPKKPFQPFGTHSYKCSNCWKFVAHEVDDNCDLGSLAEWCPYCGSRIDWSE